MAYTNIDDPSAFFQVALYNGTAGDNNAITNDGNSDLQPDWLLFKHRTASTQDWYVVDSSRGSTKGLATNTTAAETTSSSSTKDFQTFNTDGFTVGTPEDTNACNSGGTHAAWQWKAGGGTTTSVSASGTGANCINASTHQVNQDAGFSIITYTGRADQITVHQTTNLTHGLGVAPNLTIMKKRDGVADWVVMGKNVTSSSAYSANEHLHLNTDAAISDAEYTGYYAPTSTHIRLGDALVNDTGDDYVCYAFAEKQGYSKFGKYVGNAVTNGTFIYTGFKPACIITKTVNATEGWGIYDNKRQGFNVFNDVLGLDTQGATYGGSNYNFMDILSNGFKCRRATYGPNQSATYIYMAFAENPFVTSTGIPTTAR